MNRRNIIGLVLVLVVGVIGLNVLTHPGEQEDENQTDTIDTGELPDDPSGEPETPATKPNIIDEAESCYEIPPSPIREKNLIRIESSVGETIIIEPSLLGVSFDAPDLTWVQVFPEMTDTWYASHHILKLNQNDNGSVTASAQEPGVYRLRVTANESEHLLEVQVTKELWKKWETKGVIFGDVWGELGAPAFNNAPDDPECRELVLSHAMEGPVRVGANWVGVVPAVFYTQVLPTPVFTDMGNFLSLTNESYYAALVDAAHSHYLQVVHIEQSAPHWELTPEDYSALETKWSDPVWVDAWFQAWKEYIVPRAMLAERNGVEMFVLYLYPDTDTFKAEGYVEGWKDIITEVRNVYSGEIAFNVINADERLLPLINDLDAVLITIFPGLYTSGLQDVYNPTVTEVAEITTGFFNAPKETIAWKIPVYYFLTVQSADGQMGSEDPEWKLSEEGVDFNEQVIYYEGVFKALENETWVDGFFSERWDYFDQYNRVGDSYEAAYFDNTREASPRCKPAEDLIRLWFELR